MPDQSVVHPSHVETVITLLQTGSGREVQKWKYSRYFDKVQFLDLTGKLAAAGRGADQTEIHNLGADRPRRAESSRESPSLHPFEV